MPNSLTSALDVRELLDGDPDRWDRRIAADLADEVKKIVGEKDFDIPEIRRFLAVKGYRDLKAYLLSCSTDLQGEEAVRAMIHGMRRFAHERPGISAATFRNAITDCAEWREAGDQLASTLSSMLEQINITGSNAQHALRIIRATVRGFVIHEMQGSFLEALENDETFAIAVDVLMLGLMRLRSDKGRCPPGAHLKR